MGLEDLVPDDKKDTSSRSRSRRSEPEEDKVVIGKGRLKKEFTQERWKEVKESLQKEMGLVPNEVVNNYPAEERFETIHEAALLSLENKTAEELGIDQNRCMICNSVMGESEVEIRGLSVCVHHTAGQIESYLNDRGG